MTFRVLEYPRDEKLLRRKARPVRDDEFGTPALYDFAQRLADTMIANRGMGLASTQVEETGSDDGLPWRLFILSVNGQDYAVVCNPEIISATDAVTRTEACLSFASVGEAMVAPEVVAFRTRSTDGVPDTLTATELEARAVYHETQHLDGALLIDRMGTLKRRLFLKAVAKARGRR